MVHTAHNVRPVKSAAMNRRHGGSTIPAEKVTAVPRQPPRCRQHQSPISSVWEILGLNGMFAALFVGSAWLFRRAARRQPPADEGPRD